MKAFFYKLLSYMALLVCCSNGNADSIITNVFSSQGERYVVRGNPIASDNYHDISNFEINSTQGFPNKKFKIRFGGVYKYFLNKELTQEAIVKININWGDGKTDSYTPSAFPFEAEHRFGVDWVEDSGLGIGSWRINVTSETTYDIKISMTTLSGTVFTSNVSYTIHMNENGFGSPAGTKNVVKDYWRNDECVMINSICYLEEVVVHNKPKKNLTVSLLAPDFWTKGKFTHYEGLEFHEKIIPCESPWVVVNGRCRKSTTIPGDMISYPAETFIWSGANIASWWQWQATWLKGGYDFSLMSVDWTVYWRPLVLWGGNVETRECNEADKRVSLGKGSGDPLPNGNQQYFFSGNCVKKAVFAGCLEGGESPVLKDGSYLCQTGTYEDEVIHEFDREWDTCRNKQGLNHAKDSLGNINVSGDFSCYSSIIVKNTCEYPFMLRNGRCEWDEVISTPIYDESSSNIPKDTYGR